MGKEFEAKRQLSDRFDKVLVDDRIIRLVPQFLGKHFYAKKKFPVQVNLKKKNLKDEINRCINTSQMPLNNHGASATLVVGHSEMKENELAENVEAAIRVVEERYPGGWINVRSAHLLCEKTSLPLYMTDRKGEEVGKVQTLNAHRNVRKAVKDELSTIPGATVTVTSDGAAKIKRVPDPEWDTAIEARSLNPRKILKTNDFDDKKVDEDNEEEDKEDKEDNNKDKKKKNKKAVEGQEKNKKEKKSKKKKKEEESESEDDMEDMEMEYMRKVAEEEEEIEKKEKENMANLGGDKTVGKEEDEDDEDLDDEDLDEEDEESDADDDIEAENLLSDEDEEGDEDNIIMDRLDDDDMEEEAPKIKKKSKKKLKLEAKEKAKDQKKKGKKAGKDKKPASAKGKDKVKSGKVTKAKDKVKDAKKKKKA